MANPTKYDPDYSFSGFQASNPSKPLPAASLDNELANVSQSIDETIDALAEVRRSDGALANGIVTPDSLSDAARLEFSRLATGVSPATQAEAEAGVNVAEYMSPATTKAAITFHVGATVLTPSFDETPDADNTAEFEAALTAVASGGRLFIPAGVWLVDGNHEVPSNVEILGPGTLKLRVDAETEILDLTGSSNVYLHQFKIDGNASIVTGATARQSRAPAIRINAVGDGNLADNTRIEGLEIFNTHGPGILAVGLTNSRIVSNHIHDTGGRGVQGGSNYDNVLVFDNHIYETYLGGIGINGQGTMSDPVGTSRLVQIIANRVHDAKHDPLNVASGIGIELIGNASGTIIGNIVHDCDSMGISTGYTADVVVVGNQVHDIAYALGEGQGFGIEASFVSRSAFVGNTVTDCRVGMYITSGEGSTFTGNTFNNDIETAYPGDESYVRQIWLRSATNSDPLAFGFGGPCVAHVISGNVFNGGHIGCFIGNPTITYDAVRDLQISGNVFRNHVDAIRSIGLGTLEDISIAGNAITDVYVSGILLSTVTRPSVRGNRIQGQRNAGAVGINFTGCADTTMVGNEFRGITGTAGVHTSCTGTALITGNVKDASVGAFDSGASSGYTLAHARGNGHYDPLWVRDTAANATWTLSAYEDVILVNTALSAAGVTVFSSTAARYKGKVVTIKDKGGQASTKNITFDGNGFAVDGGTTAIISTDYGSLRVFSDGVKWWVV